MTWEYSIHDLPVSDRPRERLLKYGPEVMATAELIAIVLGSGMKGAPVLQLSHQILMHFGSLKKLSEATVEELCEIKGLGKVKALQLKAAINLGQRSSKEDYPVKYRIENPKSVYQLVKDDMQSEKRELFVVILQDARGCVISRQLVAIGTLSQTLVHPREVFIPAIRHSAASVILVHNHPSGDPTPSPQDFEVTQALINAGRLVGIPVNDHLIIGKHSFVSLRETGVVFTDK